MKMFSGSIDRALIWLLAIVLLLMTLLFLNSIMQDTAVERQYMHFNPDRKIVDIWVIDGNLTLVDICIVYLESASSTYGASICVFERSGFSDWRLLVQDDASNLTSLPTSYAEVAGSILTRRYPVR